MAGSWKIKLSHSTQKSRTWFRLLRTPYTETFEQTNYELVLTYTICLAGICRDLGFSDVNDQFPIISRILPILCLPLTQTWLIWFTDKKYLTKISYFVCTLHFCNCTLYSHTSASRDGLCFGTKADKKKIDILPEVSIFFLFSRFLIMLFCFNIIFQANTTTWIYNINTVLQ